jgi:hypothetical protein
VVNWGRRIKGYKTYVLYPDVVGHCFMRFLLLTICIIIICFRAQGQPADTTRREVILLNNKEITVDRLLLINPKKINNIHVSYPKTNIKQYQLDTKRIEFLNYKDLKQKLQLKNNQNPDVYVDGRHFPNKDNIEIDKSFIKKVEYLNEAIRVTTRTKYKRLTTLCRGVTTSNTSQK